MTTPPRTRAPRPPVKIEISGGFEDLPPEADWDKPVRVSSRSPKERSEQQKRLDQKAAELYDAWHAAGKPRNMDGSPKTRLLVNPEGADALTALIRKTAEPRGGVPGKSVRVRIATHPSGRKAVTFAVWDKKEK